MTDEPTEDHPGTPRQGRGDDLPEEAEAFDESAEAR